VTGLIDLDQEKSIVPVGRVRACSSAWRTESIALTNQRYGSGDCRGRPADERGRRPRSCSNHMERVPAYRPMSAGPRH